MDEELRRALDELDEAEREMVEGDDWDERDPDHNFYTVACQLAYLWRGIRNPPTEPTPGRFTPGLTFGVSPIDGQPYIWPMKDDESQGD